MLGHQAMSIWPMPALKKMNARATPGQNIQKTSVKVLEEVEVMNVVVEQGNTTDSLQDRHFSIARKTAPAMIEQITRPICCVEKDNAPVRLDNAMAP